MANWLISKVTGVKLHDYGCSLKAYRREVIKNLKLYGEMHRFIPAVASWYGVRIAEVETVHHPRLRGKSKYGISRTIKGGSGPDYGKISPELFHKTDPVLSALLVY